MTTPEREEFEKWKKENAALKAENEMLRIHEEMAPLLIEENKELNAENEKLRKDAARYLWLRNNSCFETVYIEVSAEIHDDKTLDAAIDAAMADKGE